MAIHDKTLLPLKLVTALLVAAVGLAGAAAVAQFQTRENSSRIEKLEDSERDHDRRIQRSEDLGAEVRDQLKEMRQDLKQLLRRQQP